MTFRRIATLLAALLLIGMTLPLTVVASPPDAQPDSANVVEDTATVINVLGNDNTDAGPNVVIAVTVPANGSVVITNAGADVTYTPALNYNGPDSFDYTVDNGDGPIVATVTITVTPVNDPPVATPDSGSTNEDTAVDINVLANDSDVDVGDTLTITDPGTPQHGVTTVVSGKIHYVPTANYHGPDSFTYTVSDGNGGSDTALVSVTVTAVNDPPNAVPDSASTNEDTAVNIDVLANDTDPDAGDILTITSPGNPPHGTTTIVSGKIHYVPDLNYNGPDSFTYAISDGHGGVDNALVSVTVNAVNDPPNAVADIVTINEDTPVDINVLANDTDPDADALTITDPGAPPHGTTTIVSGKIHYVPDTNYNGTDTFTYSIADGHGGVDSALVTVHITAVNDPPVAVDDFPTIAEDAPPTLINVLSNDTDVENDALTVTGVTQGTLGAVSFTSSGVTYVPNANANGSDTFTYSISDGHGGVDTGTVHVTLTPVNDPPVAVADAFTINEDTPTDFDVRANDTDIDGDTLTITDPGTPQHGVTTVVSGKIHYVPTANYHGPDSFTYTVSDGNGGSDTALVSVTVTAVNDPPVANDDNFSVAEDLAIAQPLNVLVDDTDVDGDALSIVSFTAATKGTVAFDPAHPTTQLTYKPFHNAFGADSFTYTITDGLLQSTATVTIDIGGTNDPPIAGNDSVVLPEGAGATPLAVLANDSDPDNNNLQIVSKTNGSHGVVAITGLGTGLTYDPTGNYHGTDTFTYTISDGNGGTDTATVLVNVLKDTSGPVISYVTERFIGQTVGSKTTKVRIVWTGHDTGSGLGSYLLQMSVNNAPFHTVTLAHATTFYVDITFTAGVQYRFRVRATDRDGNIGAFVYTPTMRAASAGETTGGLTYIDPWWTTRTSKALGGATKAASSTSRRAIWTFNGMDVSWITTRYTISGSAQVLIDGVLQTTVNLKRSSTAYRQLVYAFHFASVGIHTIEIHPVGNGRVDIDGFTLLH